MDDNQILDLLSSENSFEKGFKALVVKYQKQLYWQIRKIVLFHEDADDVIQNTFIKVFRNINKFEGKSKLFTWLYRIAYNESITHINKKKRIKSIGIDSNISRVAEHLLADDFFDGDMAELHLQKAIYSLPDKQKQVFNFRYFEEMSYKEISNLLGTSVGALKASYHLAAKKIELYLNTEI